MSTSVNTNVGALVALQSLNRTNSELNTVQKRISTGFRVADGADDGAAFSVAQGLRADVKGYEAVNERLGSAKGLVTVALEGARGVSDTVNEIRKVLVKLADATLSTDERTQYTADYASLKTEVTNFISQSTYNGVSLLTGTAANNIIFNNVGGTFSLVAQNLAASNTTNLTAAATATAAAALITATGSLQAFETAVGTALSTIGSYKRAIDNQDNFIKVLSDATTAGIGAIVDADLAKESALLQSLQIRQQLGTQALSIANQAPSSILSLFRG